MELRQLKYFLAVGEELSFSRAAERCYVSQSAISLQIAKLEREMGEALFERTSRTVRLTVVGAQLVSIARHMMELEQTALALTARRRNQLRLTGNMTFAANAIAAIVAVRERHPEAEIDFVLKRFAEQIEAVTSGDCQVALIRGSVERSGLHVTELWTEDLVVVLADGHPLASEDNPNLEQLAAYPLLLPKRSEQILLHRVIEGAMKRSGLRLAFGPPVAPDHTASAELLNHPECWSIIYASTAESTPKTGLVFRTEAQHRLQLPVSAVVDASSPATDIQRDLIDALAATAPQGIWS
ncbi:MAG: LysR family transcriptional regulator [Rhodococcus sp. (in: high G+C Gram-positive bacteria)]|jgi:DNA-binding transcriptional LysR family regulator|uniref:LysR substrate-binding domain-containing protein n=1 Tax=Rhodococcus sp. EPR-157 TaxID=1813677 RepID=UPI0007BC5568|nr:LysR family transcriptional regulator [Rhodococcus sp. EPR-157]KZF10413.1 transcriptional regulator [Rhodococcus sp. EPR-157]